MTNPYVWVFFLIIVLFFFSGGKKANKQKKKSFFRVVLLLSMFIVIGFFFLSAEKKDPIEAPTVPEPPPVVPDIPVKENLLPIKARSMAPAFPKHLDWLNVSEKLTIEDMRGSIVLLHFWTYGYISCSHVLSEIKRLEEKYPDRLVVIGIHSGKFANEKKTRNIREAIIRFDIRHPVVNDKDFEIWNAYDIQLWPTLMLIDPKGKIVGGLSGEDVYEIMDQSISRLINSFGAQIKKKPDRSALEKNKWLDSILAYPTKIVGDESSELLYISDSKHHRIVICRTDGHIVDIIGKGREGFEDGGFTEALFSQPMGLALDTRHRRLYIADADNHSIRRADLEHRVVETIAGVGTQAKIRNFEGQATHVELNSPWDVVLFEENLYIAMTGCHQIWKLDLTTQEISVFAGSGIQNIKDGYLKFAALAQPSGLTTDGVRLYFADSEVSAIRQADRHSQGTITTIVGRGLFDYGDIDGAFRHAKLQHPLGVFYAQGNLFVADTYNHKIKKVDFSAGTIETLIGTGTSGLIDGPADHAALYEPSGLTAIDGKLYIADRNNHCIRTYDPETGRVDTLNLIHANPFAMLDIDSAKR